MDRSIAFAILSLPIIILSWRTLFNLKSHGFYRFFSGECILLLLIFNLKYWFDHPFSFPQVISWIFLLYSVYLVTTGVISLNKVEKSDQKREEKALFQFEKTAELIQTGII